MWLEFNIHFFQDSAQDFSEHTITYSLFSHSHQMLVLFTKLIVKKVFGLILKYEPEADNYLRGISVSAEGMQMSDGCTNKILIFKSSVCLRRWINSCSPSALLIFLCRQIHYP